MKKLSIIQSKSVRNRAFAAIHQIQLNAKTHLLKHKDCHLKHKDSVQQIFLPRIQKTFKMTFLSLKPFLISILPYIFQFTEHYTQVEGGRRKLRIKTYHSLPGMEFCRTSSASLRSMLSSAFITAFTEESRLLIYSSNRVSVLRPWEVFLDSRH